MKVKLRRNRHNLSNYQCGTCYPGEFMPVGWEIVNPGDTFKHRINGLIRFAAMNAPIMHRVHAEFFTFYVPMRIIWSGFEDFITRVSGASTPPTMTLGNIKNDSDTKRLFDVLGINTNEVVAGSTTTVIAAPAQAYYKIWNEWVRDKDLQTALPETSTTAADYVVQRANWKKDRLTMARPFPQYGAAVTIPIGTSATVSVDTVKNLSGTSRGPLRQGQASHASQPSVLSSNAAAAGTGYENVQLTGTADLSTATSATVIAWRRAMNLQALAERMQNFGHDYRSYLASMGVQSDDGRLQKPELLASGKVPISFSEVLQTAEGTTTGVGDMYGHGIAAARNHSYKRFFKEHGIVMTMMVVRPQPIYSQTIDRKWFLGLQDGANDYYTPELERIGYQEIYNKEVYPTNPANGDADVWGYVPRYDELRSSESRVHGLFLPGESLDHWTWARGFTGTSAPALNSTFVTCDPDSRVFQDTSSESVLFCINHINIAQRMLTNNITGRVI